MRRVWPVLACLSAFVGTADAAEMRLRRAVLTLGGVGRFVAAPREPAAITVAVAALVIRG